MGEDSSRGSHRESSLLSLRSLTWKREGSERVDERERRVRRFTHLKHTHTFFHRQLNGVVG